MAYADFLSDRYGPKRPMRILRKQLQWQQEAPLDTSVDRRIDMWRRGYSAPSYLLLDLPRINPAEYLPEIARLDTYFINGPFARGMLNDKLQFGSLLQDALPVPKTLALIERGEVYKFGARENGDMLNLVEAHGSVILKPATSSHGHGVYRLEGSSELRLNGRTVTAAAVRELVAKLDDYLVVETVKQAAYARAICAESTNTVRVLTLIDPDTKEPFVAHTFHRFGTVESNPIDNWSGGGLLTACEVETGVLGPSIRNPNRTGGKVQRFSQHPDTGSQIEGVRLPHWEDVCGALLATVRAFPFLIYVGWDIAITDEGFTVIEGNSNTDLTMQMHGGLLINPKVRRFYEFHKVI